MATGPISIEILGRDLPPVLLEDLVERAEHGCRLKL
jgi:hypothetical protein